MAVRLEVWGDYALFTRPDLKAERMSYDVMTPSAAIGILEAIYWHPGIRYVIDGISVMSPIRKMCITRNEVKSVADGKKAYRVMAGRSTDPGCIYTGEDIQQRTSVILKDVHYVIDAHFDLVPSGMHPQDNANKFQAILSRRISKGACFKIPYFGCREFSVSFQHYTGEDILCPDELKGEKDLGYMLYDMDYSDQENIKPMYFRAVMVDGHIRVPGRDSEEVIRW